MTNVRIALFIIIDIVIVLAVGAAAIAIRKLCTPYKRGFFKNDESIMYPFHSSTVSSTMLYTVGFILPVTAFIIIEIFNLRHFKSISQLREINLHGKYFLTVFHIIAVFFFGAASTHLLTDIPKYTIGRLRPHFFDICKPDWSLLNVTNVTTGYITADICTGGDEHMKLEARLSFPSGHSSMAMFCAIFFILYLESRLPWKCASLIRPLIQLVAFSLAFYTCLSRITDNKHHWSDVLAGGLLGVTMGFLCFHLVKKSRQLEPKKDNDSES